MIVCRNVHKSYQLGERRVEALRGLDLTVSDPGFYAIMGASGSGKSTLLHLLGGLDVPDSGTVEVAGKRLDTMNERELTRFRRHDVGIVFQQFNLIATMTARENVELPGMLAGMPERELVAKADALLERLGVAPRALHRPEALSGGEQQRVAIARALLFEPRVLLADEPTGNLDSHASEALWSLLDELSRERGMTVIMVTHEPAAAAHCREVFLMRDGTMVGRMETKGQDASGLAAEYQRAFRSA